MFDSALDKYNHATHYWRGANVPINPLHINTQFTEYYQVNKSYAIASKISERLDLDPQEVYNYLINPDFQVEQYISSSSNYSTNGLRTIDSLLVAEEERKMIIGEELSLKIPRKIFKKDQYTPITCIKKVKLSPDFFYFTEQSYYFLSEYFKEELEEYDEEFKFLGTHEQSQVMFNLLNQPDAYIDDETTYTANSETEYYEDFASRNDGIKLSKNGWYLSKPVFIDNRPLEDENPKKLVIQRKYSK